MLGITRVSNRGRGEAGAYGERSPEFEQTVAELSRRRCQGYRACAGEREVPRDAPGDGECARVVEEARGDGVWPESSPEGVGAEEGSERIPSSLVAPVGWGLGEKGKGSMVLK